MICVDSAGRQLKAVDPVITRTSEKVTLTLEWYRGLPTLYLGSMHMGDMRGAEAYYSVAYAGSMRPPELLVQSHSSSCTPIQRFIVR